MRKNTHDGQLTVPAGKLFVLGDNRDNSLDSRYLGFIEESAVVGKPLFIVFSMETEGAHGPLPPTMLTHRVRWKRILQRIE